MAGTAKKPEGPNLNLGVLHNTVDPDENPNPDEVTGVSPEYAVNIYGGDRSGDAEDVEVEETEEETGDPTPPTPPVTP